MKSLLQKLFTRRIDQEESIQVIPIPPRALTHSNDPIHQEVCKYEEDQCRILARNPHEAHENAFKLLKANLNDDQSKSLKDTGHLVAIGGITGNKYKIDPFGRVYGFCVHPAYFYANRPCPTINSLPAPDKVLLMKLMIEGDEATFLDIAVKQR